MGTHWGGGGGNTHLPPPGIIKWTYFLAYCSLRHFFYSPFRKVLVIVHPRIKKATLYNICSKKKKP